MSLNIGLAAIVAGVAVAVITLLGIIRWIMSLRTVVKTDEVHVVQSNKGRVDYGRDSESGNVYYRWPEWIPMLGVTTANFRSSIFPVSLREYDGYDSGRIPFKVDIMAFFRVDDARIAAQRVSSFEELERQLQDVVRGAVRSVLGKDTLENIMQDRAGLGVKFSEEVTQGLKEWGVVLTRNIEFMDIRDSDGSTVIRNIMAKEQSRIDRESRTAVAENERQAREREIEAERQVELSEQEAKQQVGVRTAETEQQVGIASEQAQQMILQAARDTAEREMEVKRVKDTREAEIAKQVAETIAAQNREVTVINAEASRQQTVISAEAAKDQNIITADGDLEAAKKDAEAIKARGQANAEAELLMQQVPVQTQLELAAGIGANEGYQKYLINIRTVEANEKIGIEQAGALKQADVKIIVSSGDAVDGVSNAMQLFSPKGGTAIGGALEALAQTEVGRQLVSKLTASQPEPEAETKSRSKK